MNERIRALKPYPMVELARRKQARLDRGLPVWDFGTGDPIEPTAAHIRAAFRDGQPEVSQYPSVAGGAALRAGFAAWFDRRFGVASTWPAASSRAAAARRRCSTCRWSSIPRARGGPCCTRYPATPSWRSSSLYAGADTWRYALNAGNGYLMDPAEVPAEVLDRCAIVWLSYPPQPHGHGPRGRGLFEAWVRPARGTASCCARTSATPSCGSARGRRAACSSSASRAASRSTRSPSAPG
ncbi:MAG: hypothetical protein R3F30_16245 [Planctomycetota bacterium]